MEAFKPLWAQMRERKVLASKLLLPLAKQNKLAVKEPELSTNEIEGLAIAAKTVSVFMLSKESPELEELVNRLASASKLPGRDEALISEAKSTMLRALQGDPRRPAEYAHHWPRILDALTSPSPLSPPPPSLKRPKPPSPTQYLPVKRQEIAPPEWTAPELASHLNRRSPELTELVRLLQAKHPIHWERFWKGRQGESMDPLPEIPSSFSNVSALKDSLEKLLRRTAFAYLFFRRTEEQRLVAANRHAQVASDAEALAIGYQRLQKTSLTQLSSVELVGLLRDIEIDLVRKLSLLVDELAPQFVNR